MPRPLLSSLIALAVLAGTRALAAEEAYTIKPYKSKKGDRTERENHDDTKTSIVFSAGGTDEKQESASAEREAYTEEVLEKPAGAKRATRLARTYSVAEKTEKGKTTRAVYAGQAVLIEKKGDEYEFSVKGKALKRDEAPELFDEFNKKDDDVREEDLLPENPVKVGGSWTVPAEKSAKVFESLGEGKMRIDAKRSSVGGKLLRAYKKGGIQYGVIEITITVVVTEIDLGGQTGKAKPGSRMVIKATLDTCIDGTDAFKDLKAEVSVDIAAEVPDAGSVAIKIAATGGGKTRPSKK